MEKILYTGGTFDIFHYGHVNYIKQIYEYKKENEPLKAHKNPQIVMVKAT